MTRSTWEALTTEQKINILEESQRERTQWGGRPMSKVTIGDRLCIYESYMSGDGSLSEIAEAWNISKTHVWRVVKWVDVVRGLVCRKCGV